MTLKNLFSIIRQADNDTILETAKKIGSSSNNVKIGKAAKNFMLHKDNLTAVPSFTDHGRAVGKARSAKIALQGHKTINRGQHITRQQVYHMYSNNRHAGMLEDAYNTFNDFGRNANPANKRSLQKMARSKEDIQNILESESTKHSINDLAAKHQKYTMQKQSGKKTAETIGKSLLDKAADMKIPQIALGVGVTAWLVNKLSDSRGQQSNGQLYGQGY